MRVVTQAEFHAELRLAFRWNVILYKYTKADQMKKKQNTAPNEDDFGWYRFEFEISKHEGFRLLFIYCWQIKIKTARNPITQCVVVFDCQKKMHNIKGKNRPLSCASAPFFLPNLSLAIKRTQLEIASWKTLHLLSKCYLIRSIAHDISLQLQSVAYKWFAVFRCHRKKDVSNKTSIWNHGKNPYWKPLKL